MSIHAVAFYAIVYDIACVFIVEIVLIDGNRDDNIVPFILY